MFMCVGYPVHPTIPEYKETLQYCGSPHNHLNKSWRIFYISGDDFMLSLGRTINAGRRCEHANLMFLASHAWRLAVDYFTRVSKLIQSGGGLLVVPPEQPQVRKHLERSLVPAQRDVLFARVRRVCSSSWQNNK